METNGIASRAATVLMTLATAEIGETSCLGFISNQSPIIYLRIIIGCLRWHWSKENRLTSGIKRKAGLVCLVIVAVVFTRTNE